MNNGFRFEVFQPDTRGIVREPMTVICRDCGLRQELLRGSGENGTFFQSRDGELQVSCGRCGQVIAYQDDEYPV